MATIIDIDVTQTTQAVTITAEPNEYIVNINTGGGGGVESVTGTTVDNTDPLNPVVEVPTFTQVLTQGDKEVKIISVPSIGTVGFNLGDELTDNYIDTSGVSNPVDSELFLDKTIEFPLNSTINFTIGYAATDDTEFPLNSFTFTTDAKVYYQGELITELLIEPNQFCSLKCVAPHDVDGQVWILSVTNVAGTAPTSGIPHATAAGTDTYTATITGVAAYADGDAYLIRFTNGNTAGCTLNINALGAKTLYRNNDGVLIGGDIQAGAEMLCVYNSTLDAFQCIGTAPNTLLAYVTNDDTVTLTKGMVVYAFSGTGDRMTVKRASNTSDGSSAQTIGLVLSSSIAANQKGIIITQGLLDGLSILPTSTWADGDAVYLGATAGTITKVKPFAPNHLVYLGMVTTASNGSAGRMYVKVQNGYELQELHNVQAQSPALKDTLWYDSGVSPGQWKTASIPTILGYTPQNTATLLFDSIEKGILRSNYFWFLPNTVTAGQAASFAMSERIGGSSFALSGNGNITRSMTAFNTTTTPGNIAFLRQNNALQLQGYEVVLTRKIQFNSNVSGQRFFCGISKGNQFSPPTNVDQTTLTDIVGVAQLSTSTNMHVIHNDASGTATTIDLGSSYPCNDSQYNYYITIEQTTTSYIVTVERVTISTGASISTVNTLSTNIPVYNTGIIQLLTWITNNAQSSVASYLDGGAIGYLKNL